MRCGLLLLIAMLSTPAETARYELRGRLVPPTQASVWLHGATSPFEESTLADGEGRFHFHSLLAGAYTLGVFVPGRAELRETIEVGPSGAGSKGRMELTVDLRDAQFESGNAVARRAMVSARELAIPRQAYREFEEARKRLARRDADGASAHLKRAVEIAPGFAAAWNHLGTIAYQTRDYPRAERCFRQALAADANAYEPLVNLGGVLINLQRPGEALQYNRHAALERPRDALANSQLGMTYFYLGQLELSRKYLSTAEQIDPAHFSDPQLMLAEIYAREHDPAAAARELEQFLKYHPDWPQAAQLAENIARLRGAAALVPQSTLPVSDPAQAFARTGMARSFSESPDLPLVQGSVIRREGRLYSQSPDAAGVLQEARIDAAIGSGRHARILLTRSADGHWVELPVTWYVEGERYGPSPEPGRVLSAQCLSCHTGEAGDHPAAIGCQRCHGDGKPTQAVCLECHIQNAATDSGHGPNHGGDERFGLNSAAYRLFQSRCYQAAGDKLGCLTCHPAHSFSKTTAEFRQVCRGCHPTMHNSAALNCTRCHMPKRRTQDATGILVTDHRIQRPL